MILDITDVISTTDKVKTVAVEIDMVSYDSKLGSFPIVEKKPFDLCLVNDDDKRLYISGKTEFKVVIPCDRCLEEVAMPFQVRIDEELPLVDGEVTEEEDGEPYTFLDEHHLDVDRLIYDEILVNWPAKVLCRKDCKGICPKCGQNLNQQDCGCNRTVLDPRMAKFQDVFKEFKEV